MARTPILYDADCRFCRSSLALILAWDRRHAFRPVAIQSDEGAALLPGRTEAERLASAHLAPAGAAPLSGGAAAGPVLRELPGGAALAALADRLPGATERGYGWVAANRGPLSRLVPRAVSKRADALVRERA
ncbi:MAG: DUF393 domain-containing protein [Thermoleophilaceae bacterium]|nr:DUF393 domain-containing protein [Thermoleophilaceae bacterium]